MRIDRGNRIWPDAVATVGAMMDRGAIVRFACFDCRMIFDVDLHAIAKLRGREYCLVGGDAQCRASSCRGRGHFLYAGADDQPFVVLAGRRAIEMPAWLRGIRPLDIDAPSSLPPRPAAASHAAPRRSRARNEL